MIYLFDGAMGTMLQKAGLPPGACPELWCLEQPEIISAIHRQYIAAGADIIETNSFGANRVKLTHYGLSGAVKAICTAAVKAARSACGVNTKIAGSVGPTGSFIEPLGNLGFEAAFDAFKEQIYALDQAGVDYILIETIIDIQEMRAALLAAKAVTQKPVICQMTFEKNGRSVTGTDPQTAAIILDKLGADIIGANCSLGPSQLLTVTQAIASATAKPIIVQPNAGLPELIDGVTTYQMEPGEFADWLPRLIAAGASYIGGCCGTTPEHIKAAKAAVKNLTAVNRVLEVPSNTVILASRSQRVYVGQHFPPAVIGERINPTGRKAMAKELLAGSFELVSREAIDQVKAGATILDVNMGAPGLNQAEAMKQAVVELSQIIQVPLAIDTTDSAALESGLRNFPGRALVNSVSAEPERLAEFLPLAKKYGAAILCLPVTTDGVPETAAERIEIIRQIVSAAKLAGLADDDIMLDALTLTVAANSSSGLELLKTLTAYRQNFGYPAVMGLSNISFGLPRRDLLNAAFCTMALSAGLDAPILNPYDSLMKDMLAASAVLLNKDKSAKSYSAEYKNSKPPIAATPVTELTIVKSAEANLNTISEIKQCVVNGEKDKAEKLVQRALNEGYSPAAITESALTEAMNELGEKFKSGEVFLPQVLLSAETMKAAFQIIRATLPEHKIVSRGTVLLATVKGDIHDLGKNIVAALLENNGFTILDLGKDVPSEAIVEQALSNNVDIVGLCALMTTTLPQIDYTIEKLKAAGCKAAVIAGGAVLTEDYATKAGACYAVDAVAAVNICKEIIGKRQD